MRNRPVTLVCPLPLRQKSPTFRNYISDNEEEDLDNTVTKPNTPVSRSSEQIRQMKERTQSLNNIMEIPPLKINTSPQYTRGLAQANQYQQLQE